MCGRGGIHRGALHVISGYYLQRGKMKEVEDQGKGVQYIMA